MRLRSVTLTALQSVIAQHDWRKTCCPYCERAVLWDEAQGTVRHELPECPEFSEIARELGRIDTESTCAIGCPNFFERTMRAVDADIARDPHGYYIALTGQEPN